MQSERKHSVNRKKRNAAVLYKNRLGFAELAVPLLTPTSQIES